MTGAYTRDSLLHIFTMNQGSLAGVGLCIAPLALRRFAFNI